MTKKNSNTNNLVQHTFKGVDIPQRIEDGYISATAMCKPLKKSVGHYKSNNQTKEYLKALSEETGIPVSKLIQSKQGGNGSGTWVHPKVAIHLAQWLSPEFSLKVSGWILDWMSDKTTEQQPSLPAPEKEQYPALPNKTKKHTWMVTDSTGAVLELVDIKHAGNLRGQVKKYLPCHAVLAREAIIDDLDAVIYTMMEAQNKIRIQLNPLIQILGTANDKSADEFWEDRVSEAGKRLAEAM